MRDSQLPMPISNRQLTTGNSNNSKPFTIDDSPFTIHDNMSKTFLIAASLFGALGVALGAFGAHGLEKITTDEKILHGFHTGAQYQLYHALALVGAGILYDKFPVNTMKWAGYSFITGIILFSGSLYLLTFLKIQSSSAVKIVGPITPLGGVCFIAGWALLLIAVIQKKN